MEEKRRFTRTYFGGKEGYWFLGKERRIGAIRLSNLSGGGLSFFTDKALKERAPLEIELRLPPEDKRVSSRARVVWSKPSTQRRIFAVGAEFIELSNQERDVISQFVVNRLKAERKWSTKAYPFEEIQKGCQVLTCDFIEQVS